MKTTIKKRLLWLIVGLFAVGATILAFPVPRQTLVGWITGEPFFSGKPLSLILLRAQHGDSVQRRTAISSLWLGTCRGSGELEETPPFSERRGDVVSVLLEIQASDSDAQVRAESVVMLGRIASEYADVAKRVVGEFQDGLIDPQIGHHKSFALANAGSAALPALPQLVACFLHAEREQSRAAEQAIYSVSRQDFAAFPDLLKVADSEKKLRQGHTEREWMFDLLRHIAEQTAAERTPALARETLPVLVEALQDESSKISIEAARTFVELGPAAQTASESLVAALQPEAGIEGRAAYSRSTPFYRYVATALARIGSPAKAHLDHLRQLSTDQNHPARGELLEAVEAISSAAG